MRLLSLANGARFGLRAAASTVVALLVVLVASLVVAGALDALRHRAPLDLEAVVVDGAALVLVAFFVAPFASTRPAFTDPARVSGFGLSTDVAASSLALGGLIGLPALGLLIVAIGFVRAWSATPQAVGWAVVGGILAAMTAYLLGLVGSTVTARLSSRRSRQLLLAGLVLMVLLAVPFVIDLTRLLTGAARPTGFSRALGWTPFGAAASLPARAAAGDVGALVGALVVSLVGLALLWLAWRALVVLALETPAPRVVADERSGLGWFELTRGTPAGAVAGRSLTYWMRDSRYRWSLLVLPFLPLLVVPLGIAGIEWSPLALAPVPMMCLILGFLPHNDVAYDNTALWMHVAANTSGPADRLGRLAPPLVIGIPLAVIGSFVASWLSGDLGSFGPEFGVCVSLLLCGLGLSSVLSAALPYAAVRPGDDPFQQPQTTTATAGWAQAILFGGALLFTAPTGILAVRAVLFYEPGLASMALVVGIVSGVVVAAAGVAVGSLVYTRRAPELLAFALRS